MSDRTFTRFGTMLDCSRNGVMTVDAIKKWIDICADLGHNCLLLYMEDTFTVEGNPYFGHLRGRYSPDELCEIDSYGFAKGMEVIPCIQTLAHMNGLFHWRNYQQMRDCDDILLAEDDRVYDLLNNMFASLRKCFRTNMLHIGMDEAHMLGRGRYMDQHGVRDRFNILLDHLSQVCEIASKYGYTMTMWSDMFFRLASGGEYYAKDIEVSQRIKNLIPRNVELVYWDYYSTDPNRYNSLLEAHDKIKPNTWFAGGLWTWAGFAPHNQFSMESMVPAMTVCRSRNVQNIFLTMWGDDGNECSKFALLPALYYLTEFAKGNSDKNTIKADFLQKYSIPFDAFMLLDLPGTPNQVSGRYVNPDKYMLYCDCFMGQFDNKVQADTAETYAACAKKLSKWEHHPKFGYLFRSAKAMCDVLAVKCDIGVRTRHAYLSGNRHMLENLVTEYSKLEELVEIFYGHYRTQWLKENKIFGFEVIDIRLGGLMRRIRHCRTRLEEYLSGTISVIQELEEPVLDCQHLNYGNEMNHVMNYGSWKSMVSVGIV